jgi:hypothetical protein
MTNVINQEVSVNAFYFAGQGMKTFPREIEFGGQEITFASGLRYLVRKGSEAMRVFDMSGVDGLTYRLLQQGNNWTLVGTKGAL